VQDAGTIRFEEVETSAAALAIIRYDSTSVTICLSLEGNGDVEVVMKKEDARALLEALKTAIG
jgi:hypothetical protein